MSKTISLDAIRTDGGTQSRECLSEEIVAEYSEAMNDGADFPPIVVFHDGSDHWLADGFHRYFAAKRAGIVGFPSDVRKGTREDALWFAIGANKTNGQRPNRGDVKHAVKLALETWPDKTQREIAKQVGCGLGTVNAVKKDVFSSEHVTLPTTRTDSIGREQPTSKPRKPKPEEGSDVKSTPNKEPREVRVRQISEMAAEGYRAAQIASALGIGEYRVRGIAKEENITLPDAAMGKCHRINSRRVIEQAVMALDAAANAFRTVPFKLEDITREDAAEWADSVANSLRVYRGFHTKLKEYASHE